MKNKFLIVLCEGPHDIAFLSRLLKLLEFKSISENLSLHDYPIPLDKAYKNQWKKAYFDEEGRLEIKPNFPVKILQKEKTNLFILLHKLGGNSQIDVLKKIIAFYKTILKDEQFNGEEIEEDNNNLTSFNLCLFEDADQKGIVKTIDAIKSKLNDCGLVDISKLKHNEWIKNIVFDTISSYIFTEIDSDKGRLEDIILPLMKKGNETIFDNARSYYSTNFRKKRKKDTKKDENEYNSETIKKDEMKALIGIAGQLQRPGASNVSIIEDVDYLHIEKIATDPTCKEIIDFFKKLLDFIQSKNK